MNKTEENDGKHIANIIGSVPCARHAVDIGDACWNIGSARGILKAICNRRALAAGANGQVTPYKKPGNDHAHKKKEYQR